MDIVHQKEELKESVDTFEEILAIKSQKQFDFDKEWARSISISEARIKSKTIIVYLSRKNIGL